MNNITFDMETNDALINFYKLPAVINSCEIFVNENKHWLNKQISQNILNKIIDKMQNYDMLEENEEIIMLNVNKINDCWKKSKDYIDTNFENILNKKKYLQLRKYLIDFETNKQQILKPSNICFDEINEINDIIEFIDGRNRFSNYRDLGIKYLPFIINKEDNEKILNICT